MKLNATTSQTIILLDLGQGPRRQDFGRILDGEEDPGRNLQQG
jgi:hypothetical protein